MNLVEIVRIHFRLITEVIVQRHAKCDGCQQVKRIPHEGNACICCGVVANQKEGPEFDIIRLCTHQNGKWYSSAWAPDEALAVSVGLVAATRVAMLQDGSYQKFREM